MNKKGEFKITTMFIGVLLVSLFAVFFTSFLNETTTNYGGTLSNKTTQELSSFNKQSELLSGVEDSSQKALNTSQGKDFTDLLGGFFKSGYSAVIITKDSVDTVQSVSTTGLEAFNLDPQVEQMLRIIVPGIILILVVIGVLISILVRRNL